MKKLLKSKKATEVQVGGNHYKDMVIQPSVYCQLNKFNHLESNTIKYVSRHGKKDGKEGGIKDIKKAIHSLLMILELEYDEEYNI